MNGKQRIVSALNRQPVDRTPVWFMRQAGRHLPEYRKIAAEHNFWERCMDVDLCKTITLQPLERYQKIDAAIIFSDILTPPPSLGYEGESGGGIRISKQVAMSTLDFGQLGMSSIGTRGMPNARWKDLIF